jgi:hypothetical protein
MWNCKTTDAQVKTNRAADSKQRQQGTRASEHVEKKMRGLEQQLRGKLPETPRRQSSRISAMQQETRIPFSYTATFTAQSTP